MIVMNICIDLYKINLYNNTKRNIIKHKRKIISFFMFKRKTGSSRQFGKTAAYRILYIKRWNIAIVKYSRPQGRYFNWD